MKITFLGATGTVTGSKYLVQHNSQKILVDCGLFQGYKQLRLRNWEPLPVDPKHLNAVILTHAHLDHSGYLPLLVKNGFSGKIYCTKATHALCKILLPDSGYLQEEEAEYANKRGFSKHSPALPLYTKDDALYSLQYFAPIEFGTEVALGPDLSFRLSHSGHLLGSSFVALRGGRTSILFSGDLGRPNDVIMLPPDKIEETDYLILESTYGARAHKKDDPKTMLAAIINRTAARRGVVIIPSFAVGRAQAMLYLIHLLKSERIIPDMPVYLNSPMAVNASRLLQDYIGEHRLSIEECNAMYSAARIVNSVEDSKALNDKTGPMIIISASGMATGGRVLHHIKAFGPAPRNTILFVGYQAGGTRGGALIQGARDVKIHGQYIPINAEVTVLDNLSAHADYTEILGWLRNFKKPPKQTFLTHGEPDAADALRHRIEETLNWPCHVSEYKEEIELD